METESAIEYAEDTRYTRAYGITRLIVRLFVPLLGGVTIKGAENIPAWGPVILAPNHRAYVDPPYLSLVTKRQLRMMAKEELFHNPLFGRYLRAMSAFPVKRGTADRAALKRAASELKAGRVVGIFPEGKRSDSGTISPAEKGFALIARQTGAQIVPVALEGTDRVLPKHGRLHRAHVTATIGEPRTAKEMLTAYSGEETDPLTIISMMTVQAIAALMTEPVTVLDAPKKQLEKDLEKDLENI